MKLCIVLTGTIRPSVLGGNFNVEERLEMYYSTLSFYAKTIGTSYPIVFVENSDVDLTSWKDEFAGKLDLEIIQFLHELNVFKPEKGKGYNEYLMIKMALTKSENLKKQDYFLKITGRYSMLNIKQMINEAERRIMGNEIIFMGDVKDTKIYEYLGIKTYSSHWGDSRFFLSKISFYEEILQNCYLEMDDRFEGKWAEDYFLRLSRIYRNDHRFVFRWRHQVQFNGVSGTLTSDQLEQKKGLQDSYQNRLKNVIRFIIRVLLPNLWI